VFVCASLFYPCSGDGGAGGQLAPAAVPTGKSVLFLVGNCIGSDKKDAVFLTEPANTRP
jgi:hypothetical protein